MKYRSDRRDRLLLKLCRSPLLQLCEYAEIGIEGSEIVFQFHCTADL